MTPLGLDLEDQMKLHYYRLVEKAGRSPLIGSFLSSPCREIVGQSSVLFRGSKQNKRQHCPQHTTRHSTIAHPIQLTTMAAPTYIISRVADPIFAVFIGVSAAATRINREQKEKGKSTQDTIDLIKRCVDMREWFIGSLLMLLCTCCVAFPTGYLLTLSQTPDRFHKDAGLLSDRIP